MLSVRNQLFVALTIRIVHFTVHLTLAITLQFKFAFRLSIYCTNPLVISAIPSLSLSPIFVLDSVQPYLFGINFISAIFLRHFLILKPQTPSIVAFAVIQWVHESALAVWPHSTMPLPYLVRLLFLLNESFLLVFRGSCCFTSIIHLTTF